MLYELAKLFLFFIFFYFSRTGYGENNEHYEEDILEIFTV